jgi:hypothetical protein
LIFFSFVCSALSPVAGGIDDECLPMPSADAAALAFMQQGSRPRLLYEPVYKKTPTSPFE